MGKNAASALDEYLAFLRSTPEYAAGCVVADEIERVLTEVGRRPGAPIAFSDPLIIGPRGGDMAYGHGAWESLGGERVHVWRFGFIERWQSGPHGMSANHTLHPDGSGGVWLGECNNSARFDASGDDAAGLWAARVAWPALVKEADRG